MSSYQALPNNHVRNIYDRLTNPVKLSCSASCIQKASTSASRALLVDEAYTEAACTNEQPSCISDLIVHGNTLWSRQVAECVH